MFTDERSGDCKAIHQLQHVVAAEHVIHLKFQSTLELDLLTQDFKELLVKAKIIKERPTYSQFHRL